MALHTAELIFNDKPTKNNRDLISFLDRNLSEIVNRGRMRFRFRIATPDYIEKLRAQNIRALPALHMNNRFVVGVPDIIQELRSAVKNSKGQAPKKTEEEVLNDFFQKELAASVDSKGKITVPDDDDDHDPGADLAAKANREFQRRGLDKNQTIPVKPSRQAIRDNDEYETRRDVEHRPSRNKSAARPDNLVTDDRNEAQRALRNIKGSDPQDDDMMAALLDRMDYSAT